MNECFASGLPVYFAREELYLDPHDLEAKKKYTDAVSRAMDYVITLRRNLSRGLKRRAKSGKLVGGRSVHLFGYDYSNGKRTPNEKSQIVIVMFTWVAEGAGLNGVADRLMEMGILTPTGKTRWNTSTIGKILKNRAYIGKPKSYHGVEMPDCTPLIISEDLFNQVQERLRANKKSANRNAKAEYLLRGHVYCSHDYRKYYGQLSHGKDRYYYCSGRLKSVTSDNCDNKTYKANYLEDVVKEKVTELLTRPDVILDELERRKHEANEVGLIAELSGIDKRIAQLDKEQEELLHLGMRGFPLDMVDRENLKINQYRTNLQEWRLKVSSRIKEAKQNELDLADVKYYCELASRNLAHFTYADWRLAIETLRIEVWIDGNEIFITGAVPACDIATTQLKPGHQGW